jgi:signal transduction histidine kinase
MTRCPYLLWLAFFLTGPVLPFSGPARVQAPVIALTDSRRDYAIGGEVLLLEDPTGQLELSGVLRRDSLFRRSRQAVPVYGATASAVWATFRVRNGTASEWYLEVDNAYLVGVDLYAPAPGGRTRHVRVGVTDPFSQRPVLTTPFILPLALKLGEERTFFLRLESNSVMRFPLRIATMQTLYETNHVRDVADGIYFGLVITLVLYNLFVFLSLRDKTYLYYVLYILSLGLNVGYIRGYNHQFLLPWGTGLNHSNYWAGSSVLFGILFSHSFLRLRAYAPRLRPIGWVIAGLAVFTLFLSMGGYLLAGFRVQLAAVMLFLPTVFVYGFSVYRKGFEPARYYLMAFGVLGAGVFTYFLKDVGVIPQNPLTEATMQIGPAAEAIILSFALARKLNVYKREKEAADRQALEQATAFSQALIRSQEHERQRIAAELHDGVGQSLIVVKNKVLLLRKGAPPGEKGAAALDSLAEYVTSTIGEVRRISYGLRPFQLDLLGLTQSVRSLAEASAEASQMHLETDLADLDGLFSPEAEINIYRIVQECLNNAVKHSGATAGRVVARTTSDWLTLVVEDNGRGFTLEKGSDVPGGGFGLLGIRERLNILGGRLEVRQAEPQGTRILITIPIPQTHANPAHSHRR